MQEVPAATGSIEAPSLRDVWDEAHVVDQLRRRQALGRLSSRSVGVAFAGCTLFGTALGAYYLVGTTGHYVLAQWLAIGIGAAGGIAGFRRFLAGYVAATGDGSVGSALRSLAPYFLLFSAVGGQLAWVLRPFIGSPSLGFQLFRASEGNIFVHVLGLLGR